MPKWQKCVFDDMRINAMRISITLLILFILFNSGCVTRNISLLSGVAVTKSSEFPIVQSAKSLGWGFASHSFLLQFPSGEIHCYFFTIGDGLSRTRHDASLSSSPIISRDGGKTWISGHDLYRVEETPWNPPESSTRCGLFNMGDDYLWFHQASKPIKKAFWGKAGAEPESGFMKFPGKIGTSTRGLCLADGELLIDGYVERTGSKRHVECAKSKDGGLTWEVLATIADASDSPWGREGPNESAMVILPNGELLCIMRTGHDITKSIYAEPQAMADLLEARSRDGGVTWEHKRLKIKGVMPKLVLMSNGVLVLATGRPGNILYFSTDAGHTWGSPLNLTSADVKTSGYCDITEVEPGRLLAVYDMYDTDKSGIWLWEPKEANGVYGCFVDVKRLWGGAPKVEVGGRRSDVGDQGSDVGCRVPETGDRVSDEGEEEKGTGSPVKKSIDLRL
ncbi:MAG: sialidase family protein [Kiritimatiellae bacterium]|nr:sialidase family protein [Kiritimatiellia bacterium]